MKRLRRIAWNGLFLVSALLFVATCVSWVRSHWRRDSYSLWNTTTNGDRQNCITLNTNCDSGEIYINLMRGWQTVHPIPPFAPIFPVNGHWNWESGPPLAADEGLFGALRWQPTGPKDQCDFRELSVWAPHWAFALCFGILPAFWIRGEWRAMIERRVGRCRRCGYDLRATPDKCPECGTIPADKGSGTA